MPSSSELIPAIKPPPVRHHQPAQPSTQGIQVDGNDDNDEDEDELKLFQSTSTAEKGKEKEMDEGDEDEGIVNAPLTSRNGGDIEQGINPIDNLPKNIMQETSSASLRRVLSVARPELWFLIGGTCTYHSTP